MGLRRMVARVHAHTFGYFWLPCPTCGEEFGGHEVTDSTRMAKIIRGDSRTGCVLCPLCSVALADRPQP